ncbi:hypothetical protein [Bacillus sp. es.036]|uniref:hypothetical protein n=1 Tax=Bacillus sp. es.036 TaxID=1761764 RepID=UPI000BF74D6F|nr:hypothetical protein [Bacillus sp. es.036]
MLEVIERKETSKRGNYLRLLNKHNKTKEEHLQLHASIRDIEEMYNALTPIERKIRDPQRRLIAVYPNELIEVVYSELEKIKGRD